jgi:hypothetical protein
MPNLTLIFDIAFGILFAEALSITATRILRNFNAAIAASKFRAAMKAEEEGRRRAQHTAQE